MADQWRDLPQDGGCSEMPPAAQEAADRMHAERRPEVLKFDAPVAEKNKVQLTTTT